MLSSIPSVEEDESSKTTFYVKGGGKTGALLTGSSIIIDNPSSKWNITSSSSSSSSKALHIYFRDVIKVITTDNEKAVRSVSRLSLDIRTELLRVSSDSRELGGTLTIHYVHKDPVNNKWTTKKIVLQHRSEEVALKWSDSISSSMMSEMNTKRPKKLLVYINPYGGKRTAINTYKKQVAPLMDLAGIECTVDITQHANYARDSLLTRDLTDIDGVICVGGDGMFSEIFNGMLTRTAREAGIDIDDKQTELVRPKIRVGVIPGGSTDAVALSLHGTSDIETIVLHIILGDERHVDVTSVYKNDTGNSSLRSTKLLRFNMAMVSYGYFGDLLKRSEKCRWMGPSRYDFSGFQTLIRGSSYDGVISFVKDESNDVDPKNKEFTCSNMCKICAKHSVTTTRNEESKLITKVVKGRFMAVTAASFTCACPKTIKGVSPNAHLGDGFTDLILIKECSRMNYWRYLFRTGFAFDNPFDLPFVEVHRVKEFSFHPGNSLIDRSDTNPEFSSVWNCDGEIVDEPNITIKINRQLLPTFAQGVPRKNIFKNKSAPRIKKSESEPVQIIQRF